MKKRLGVFGSTGTIGTNTLELVRRFPDLFEVEVLTAGRNIALLEKQILEFRPRLVVVSEGEDAARLGRKHSGVEFLHGDQGLVECAKSASIEIACQGIVGFAALASTLELVKTGKTVALANKEALVVAGNLLRQASRKSGSLCIPVDSEHNALFQLLLGKQPDSVESLVLTASGGPFWRQPELDFKSVTPEMAIRHPNWKMGPKISVDSATLMNKGLELVEAHALFDTPLDQIEVWIHPQSIVHGAVWFKDGTCQAQLSKPDMKASIGFALGYPHRLPAAVEKLSLSQFSQLDFAEPDTVRFPLLNLPRQALQAGQSYLVALNAGNEIAVNAFLVGQIGFHRIPQVLATLVDSHSAMPTSSLEEILDVDRNAREKTQEIIRRVCV